MGDKGSVSVWRFFRQTAGGAKQHTALDGGGDGWEVYPQGESEGRCDCCRSVSKQVWGEARSEGLWEVAYSIQWTPGVSKKKHPANFDFIVRSRGETAIYVSMILYDRDDGGVGVMVIDASLRPFANEISPGAALSRDKVVGTPLAARMFALFDAIWIGDPRMKQLA